MLKENVVIRTSLGNNRMMSREISLNALTKASTSSAPPLGGPSPSQKRWKKGNKRRFVETNKQINISHEGGVLNGSFQGDTSENLQVSHDGGVLKAYAINNLAPRVSKFDLES